MRDLNRRNFLKAAGMGLVAASLSSTLPRNMALASSELTEWIHQQIDRLPEEGGCVFMPSGHYSVEQIDVPLKSGLKIYGEGPGTVIEATGDKIFNLLPDTSYRSEGQDLVLSDFKLIADDSLETTGIYARMRHQLKIKDIYFRGKGMTGVIGHSLNNSQITGGNFCRVKTAFRGIGDMDNTSVSYNQISYCEEEAIYGWACEWLTVALNDIEESNWSQSDFRSQIYMESCKQCLVDTNMVVQGHKACGIKFNGTAERPSFSNGAIGNRCFDNDIDGLYFKEYCIDEFVNSNISGSLYIKEGQGQRNGLCIAYPTCERVTIGINTFPDNLNLPILDLGTDTIYKGG